MRPDDLREKSVSPTIKPLVLAHYFPPLLLTHHAHTPPHNNKISLFHVYYVVSRVALWQYNHPPKAVAPPLRRAALSINPLSN